MVRPRGIRALAPLLLLVGCLPIPDVQLPIEVEAVEYRLDPEAIATELISIDGFPEAHTPTAFNRSYVLRYAVDEPTDTVLLLMPGIFGGATSFDPLARQLVASTPGLEVWALDRRANALEDRSAFVAAVQGNDPDLAYDYYHRRARTPEGFNRIRKEEVDFMAFWGLDVHLADLHQVVLEARRRAPRVILGGHSLGASLISFYASYTVGADTVGADAVEADAVGADTVGYEYIDGLVFIDGVPGRTGAFERNTSGLRIGPIRISPSIDELTAGRAEPFFDLGITPETFVERELAATLAWLDPEGLAPEGLSEYPITNRALAGVHSDDEYGVVPLFDASVGHAVDADFSGNLIAFVLGGTDAARSRSVSGVAEGAGFVDWSPGDPRRERTDLEALLKAWVNPDADFAEWYFPLRLAYDVTLLDAPLAGATGFAPTREVPLPTLALGAGRGLIPSLDGFGTYVNLRYGSPVAAYILPGLTHIDIVLARENPVVAVFRRWLSQL